MLEEMLGQAEDIGEAYFNFIDDPDAWGGVSDRYALGCFDEACYMASAYPLRNARDWLVCVAYNGLALVILDYDTDHGSAIESLAHLDDADLTTGYLDLLWACRVDVRRDDERYRAYLASLASDVELVLNHVDEARSAEWRTLTR